MTRAERNELLAFLDGHAEQAWLGVLLGDVARRQQDRRAVRRRLVLYNKCVALRWKWYDAKYLSRHFLGRHSACELGVGLRTWRGRYFACKHTWMYRHYCERGVRVRAL